MQKSDKRLVILVTNEEIAAIDDFRFEKRMRNRSDAVRALLKLALDQIEKILQQSHRDHLRPHKCCLLPMSVFEVNRTCLFALQISG